MARAAPRSAARTLHLIITQTVGAKQDLLVKNKQLSIFFQIYCRRQKCVLYYVGLSTLTDGSNADGTERKRKMNTVLLYVLLITAIAGVGGTGLGGVVSMFFRRDSKKQVSLLLSFAAGVMLAVVCFDLISSAMAEGGNDQKALLMTVLGVVIGFTVIALLNFWIDKSTNREIKHVDKSHPKTADDLDELIHSDHYEEHKKENDSKSQLFIAGIIMAAAIALHNLPEGMVIGAAYVGTKDVSGLLSGSGIMLALVIGLHNIPEGMAIAVPLIAGGMNRGKAVLMTALSGLPTVLGALIGYQLGAMGAVGHILSLGFASGAMLYVVFGELLPESILMWKSKLPAVAIVTGILVGLIVIYA